MRGCSGVTLELGRARHLNVLVIADDVHHGIGARFLSTLLKVYQGSQERRVACFFIISLEEPRRHDFIIQLS